MSAAKNLRGVSTIIHSTRIKLNLTVQEYCLADMAWQLHMHEDGLDEAKLCQMLGLNHDQYDHTMKSLTQKGILCGTGFAEKWLHEFNGEENFRIFFEDIFRKRGTRKVAYNNYKLACRLIEREELHRLAKIYVEGCSEWKYIMFAEKFLNSKQQRWLDVVAQQTQDPSSLPTHHVA